MGDSRPTVQRTLVKSPPELWADLSDPESLARRLGEFGEIRITRLVPEKTVAWEGERASGTVEIEPSGWGTKVRLSATATAPATKLEAAPEDDLEREMAVEAALRREIEREAAIEAALRVEIEREAAEEAALRAEAEAQAQATLAAERQEAARTRRSAPAVEQPSSGQLEALEPARGFFSRLRNRRRTDAAEAAPAAYPLGPVAAARPSVERVLPDRTNTPDTGLPPAAPARPVPAVQRQPVRLSALAFARANPSGQAAPLSTATAEFDKRGAETITASRRPRSESPSKPTLDDEQTLAVLASVLDDLGAAHHRPFSRE